MISGNFLGCSRCSPCYIPPCEEVTHLAHLRMLLTVLIGICITQSEGQAALGITTNWERHSTTTLIETGLTKDKWNLRNGKEEMRVYSSPTRRDVIFFFMTLSWANWTIFPFLSLSHSQPVSHLLPHAAGRISRGSQHGNRSQSRAYKTLLRRTDVHFPQICIQQPSDMYLSKIEKCESRNRRLNKQRHWPGCVQPTSHCHALLSRV